MAKSDQTNPLSLPNIRRFIAFRVLFNARFYYPVFTIIFLDFGLSLEQFAILNVVWAASIVLLEVPSGAMADTIGRRNLVVIAAAIMIVEMLLLCFAPIGNSQVVFYLFMVNRILSGAAEAAASGADEALAYDTMKEAGMEKDWGRVLEIQMRRQSIAFVIAMSLGAILYDHTRLNAFLEWLSIPLVVSKEMSMRLPLFLTLALGFAAFFTTLGMRETSTQAREGKKLTLGSCSKVAIDAFRKTFSTGGWILRTPAALIIILAGFLFDHIARMILTLNSQYYRLIDLPEASFGFIGSGLALLGIFIPRLGRWLVENKTKGFNFTLLGLLTLVGLWLMSLFTPIWGALPMLAIYVSIFLTGFFVSHYLNEVTDSDIRATALSFKGLSFNLAYGGIGILYSWLVNHLRQSEAMGSLQGEELENSLFIEAMSWFPGYFAIVFTVILLYGFSKRKTI